MTEEYKKNLIDYVTNKLETGTPTTEELIKEQSKIPRSKWRRYLPNGFNKLHIEGIIKPSEKTSNIGILYGGYQVYQGTEIRGIIILTDVNFNPIKYIEEFSTGTKLRYIQSMIQGDDGYFYAVDDEHYSYMDYDTINSQKRFLMLNNFSVSVGGEYKVILRKSYIFNGANYQNFFCESIYKEQGTSHYVFCGRYSLGSNHVVTNTKAIELKVNVGTPNEWNVYYDDSTYERTEICSFAEFNNGNSKIKALALYRGVFDLYCLTKDYSSSSFSVQSIYTFPYRPDVLTLEQQALFLDANNVYFVIDTQHISGDDIETHEPSLFHRYENVYHYNFQTSNMELVHENYFGYYSSVIVKNIVQLDENQGKLYIANYDNIDTENHTCDYSIQRYEGTWNPIVIGENKPFNWTQRGFFVKSNYNLLQYNIYPSNMSSNYWYMKNIKEVYNPTQYNGEPYTSVDSLVPEYANLYSNNELVFSRNLYNVTKQSNSTMSSVEVPYNYLNDLDIIQNDLISKTNQELINDYTNWNKNIYEIVDVNFLNTINVIDEDTQTPYLNSAIKVNNAITDGGNTNYQNTPCTKYRLNYSDNTSSIGNITWDDINDLVKQTTISFSPVKEVKSIDLISNDESTIYMTINETFETGKLYTITQKVRIGDKPTKKEVHYRG